MPGLSSKIIFDFNSTSLISSAFIKSLFSLAILRSKINLLISSSLILETFLLIKLLLPYLNQFSEEFESIPSIKLEFFSF